MNSEVLHLYIPSHRESPPFSGRAAYFGPPCTARLCVCVCVEKRRTRTAFKGHSTRHGRSSGRTMASVRRGEERQTNKKERAKKEYIKPKKAYGDGGGGEVVVPRCATFTLAVATLIRVSLSLSPPFFSFPVSPSRTRVPRFAIHDARRRRRRRRRRLDRRTRSRRHFIAGEQLPPSAGRFYR